MIVSHSDRVATFLGFDIQEIDLKVVSHAAPLSILGAAASEHGGNKALTMMACSPARKPELTQEGDDVIPSGFDRGELDEARDAQENQHQER